MKKFSEQQNRITKATQELCEDYVVLAPIIHNMKMMPSLDIPTLGVDCYNRGLFNPYFVDEIDNMTLKFVLMHESLHVLLRHVPRFFKEENLANYEEFMRSNDKKLAENFRKFNIASDSVINENIMQHTNYVVQITDEMVTYQSIHKLTQLPLSKIRTMSAEEIYRALKRIQKPEQPNDQQNSNGNGQNDEGENGQNNSSSNSNSNSQQNDGQSSENAESNNNANASTDEKEILKKIASEYRKQKGEISERDKQETKNAVEMAKARAGKDSESGTIEIKDILSKNNLRWKEVLKPFLNQSSGRLNSNRSWRKPSKKYREIYPISKGRSRNSTKDLVIAIDVSGSMDADKISKAVNVLKDYIKINQMNCRYYFFSTDASELYDYKDMRSFQNNLYQNYGGGTSLDAAFHWKNHARTKGVVVITDMCFDDLDYDNYDSIVGNTQHLFINIEPDAFDNNQLKKLRDKKKLVNIY